MIRISEAVQEIVETHAALRFGFYHDLMNLTKVARFLRPSIEARTKKEVTDAAVLMNLSRLQKKLARLPQSQSRRDKLVLDKVSIQSGLCAATVAKSPTSHRELNRVFNRVQSRNGFITVTEGMREVTVIVEAENLRLVTSALSSPPRILHERSRRGGGRVRRALPEGQRHFVSAHGGDCAPEHQRHRDRVDRDRVLDLSSGRRRAARVRRALQPLLSTERARLIASSL